MFKRLHPLVQLTFYILVLAIQMSAMNPVLLLLGFIMSELSLKAVDRKAKRGPGYGLYFAMILVMALVNFLTYHDGIHILFYINYNAMTVEAMVYGGLMGLMMATVVNWFMSLRRVITEDRFIYLFGKISSTFALTVSMTFRYIPLILKRYRETEMALVNMGTYKDTMFATMKRKVMSFSTVVSWTLEGAIETGAQMEARGYGLSGRTAYHRFAFHRRDGILMAVMLTLGIPVLLGIYLGYERFYYYPEIMMDNKGSITYILIALFVLLGLLPQWIRLFDRKKEVVR